jgi:hypothetical protein
MPRSALPSFSGVNTMSGGGDPAQHNKHVLFEGAFRFPEEGRKTSLVYLDGLSGSCALHP